MMRRRGPPIRRRGVGLGTLAAGVGIGALAASSHHPRGYAPPPPPPPSHTTTTVYHQPQVVPPAQMVYDPRTGQYLPVATGMPGVQGMPGATTTTTTYHQPGYY